MSTPSDRSAVHPTAPAFSRQVDVESVPDQGLDITVEAEAWECAAISEEIDLPALSAMSARCRVQRLPGGRFQVEGLLRARVTQICVVSLDPFESEVSQPIDVIFAPVRAPLPERNARRKNGRDALRREAEMRQVPAAPPVGEGETDPPDPIIDGRIDLGVVATEFLTLALDFYPKKPGVHFNDVLIGETEHPKPSAFAVLERFKDRS